MGVCATLQPTLCLCYVLFCYSGCWDPLNVMEAGFHLENTDNGTSPRK